MHFKRASSNSGTYIFLSGIEVARAIDAYLVAYGVHVYGPRTIMVNDALCDEGEVYVDPEGFVIINGEKVGEK